MIHPQPSSIRMTWYSVQLYWKLLMPMSVLFWHQQCLYVDKETLGSFRICNAQMLWNNIKDITIFLSRFLFF